MMTCGVDIGSRTIAVVLLKGPEIVGSSVIDTGAFPKKNARDLYENTVKESGINKSDIAITLATGYGRNYFETAQRAVSEILCHAQGVSYLFPKVKTVIDIGGQDSKVIEVGEKGKVRNFAMNDRCAAGTGKFIEMVSNTLNIPFQETGPMALKASETCEISSMCAVFAESEIIGLLHQGMSPEVILHGVFKSIARRILGLAGRISLSGETVFTGGVAKNEGVLQALKQETGINSIKTPPDPQITAALGAALLAARDLQNTHPA
jgi:predicted CoA-substrate-specific enzyme activase